MRDPKEWAKDLWSNPDLDFSAKSLERVIREAQQDGALASLMEIEVVGQLCDELAREREHLNHKIRSLQGQLNYERRRVENLMHSWHKPEQEEEDV